MYNLILYTYNIIKLCDPILYHIVIFGRGDDLVGNPHRARLFFNSSFSSANF